MNNEIERKYLIEYPDIEALRQKSFRIKSIVQTYLRSEPDVDRRVRMSEENGALTYTYTEKRTLTRLTRAEDERKISREEYEAFLKDADTAFYPVLKTRYCVRILGKVAEIDVYKNIKDFAICETELESEEETVPRPDCVSLIREVTGEKEYTNRRIAKMKPD